MRLLLPFKRLYCRLRGHALSMYIGYHFPQPGRPVGVYLWCPRCQRERPAPSKGEAEQ